MGRKGRRGGGRGGLENKVREEGLGEGEGGEDGGEGGRGLFLTTSSESFSLFGGFGSGVRGEVIRVKSFFLMGEMKGGRRRGRREEESGEEGGEGMG